MKILVMVQLDLGSRFVELYPNPQELLTPDLNVFDLTNPTELQQT